jgi:hypothetical protein
MRLCCVWSCVLAACASGDRAERPADAGALHASDASAASNGGDADTGAGACALTLDDDHNCGACGHDCTVCGGTCQAGACTLAVLDSALANPGGIAVDSTYVYYADEVQSSADGGRIYALPKAGGPRVELASAQQAPLGIAVDSTGLYWIDAVSSMGSIMKLAPGAIDPVALAPNPAGTSIAVENGNVIWSGGGRAGGMWELPAGSDAPIELDPATSNGFAISNGVVYYFVNSTTSELRKATPIIAPTTIATTPESLDAYQHLAVSGDTVFLALQDGPGSGEIDSVPVTGGTPNAILPHAAASAIAADESSVYWIDYSQAPTDGHIVKAGRDGSNPTMLSTSFANTANHLAIDNHCVYVTSFVDFSSGNLMAVAK